MNDWTRWIVLGQLATTLPLVGLIWTIQVVHYPLFALVGDDGFVAYHARHSFWISTLVVPLMLAELGLAIAWVLAPAPTPSAGRLALVGLALLGLVWIATFTLSVPAHRILADGFDVAAHRQLVLTNWLRTVAWSGRGLLLIAVVWRSWR